MRRLIASVVLTLITTLITAVPGLAATHTSSMDFSPGKSLLFKLRGGDLHIKRGMDPLHILVRYTPDPKNPPRNTKFNCAHNYALRKSRLRWRPPGR